MSHELYVTSSSSSDQAPSIRLNSITISSSSSPKPHVLVRPSSSLSTYGDCAAVQHKAYLPILDIRFIQSLMLLNSPLIASHSSLIAESSLPLKPQIKVFNNTPTSHLQDDDPIPICTTMVQVLPHTDQDANTELKDRMREVHGQISSLGNRVQSLNFEAESHQVGLLNRL